MKYIKYALILSLFLYSCNKDDIDDIIIDPPDPPVVIDCELDYTLLQSQYNKLSSHYQPMNIPFVDYAALLNTTLSPVGLFGIYAASGNFDGNSDPDVVMVTNNGNNPSENEVVIALDGVVRIAFKSPQVGTRKISVKDLNQDNIDDIILFGHGPDVANSSGDYTTIIYMYGNGSYKVAEVGLVSGYHHTGAVGPLGINGGLSDIIEINSQAFTSNPEGFVKLYWNNGLSELWIQDETNIPNHWVARIYHSELFDFNNDGIMDLILGGHEWEESWMATASKTVQWRTHILKGLGNGQFDIENPIILPSIINWGVITDFDMYDLDKDGQTEIIITRTTGKANTPGIPWEGQIYDGHMIQILKGSNFDWYEWKRIEQPSEIFSNPNIHIEWPYATKVYDVNKDCLLDIVPESDKLNSSTYASYNTIRGLYYEQQENGNFLIKYKQ